MGPFLKYLFRNPLTRPLIRFLLGVIAIPAFRLFLRKIIRLQEMDKELEKDLEQWFRASLVLLVATKNMEDLLFGWLLNMFPDVGPEVGQAVAESTATGSRLDWFVLGGRILLALGVIETMPDQELFSIIHPGPPKVKFRRGRILATIAEVWRPFLKGLVCQHVNRTAPVWAILATIFDGTVGWVFYLMAITQYLIMGLVTSRDHAMEVLSEFDKQVTIRRRELMEEFDLDESKSADSAEAQNTAPTTEPPQAKATERPPPNSG